MEFHINNNNSKKYFQFATRRKLNGCHKNRCDVLHLFCDSFRFGFICLFLMKIFHIGRRDHETATARPTIIFIDCQCYMRFAYVFINKPAIAYWTFSFLCAFMHLFVLANCFNGKLPLVTYARFFFVQIFAWKLWQYFCLFRIKTEVDTGLAWKRLTFWSMLHR